MENTMTQERTIIDERQQDVLRELMRNVYLWMTGGLVLTGVIAWIVANSPSMTEFICYQPAVMWGLIIVEFLLVIVLSLAINKLSFGAAAVMFILYSALNGATLSSIFLVYELSSIAEVFFVTAGSFAVLALIGTVTKKDLSALGTFLYFALFGLIFASVLGLIFGRPDTIWMSAIGVIIFAGLTVYDAQKIKLAMQSQESVNESSMKMALMGALELYLDFINLLLRLLSLFGKKK